MSFGVWVGFVWGRVWVKGECKADKAKEQILEEEAQAKALLQAEREVDRLM